MLAAGIPMKYAGERKGLTGIQSALKRQAKEQDAIGAQMDARTGELLASRPVALGQPATQPYAPAVQSRLAALQAAMPGRAGMVAPGRPTMQPRLSSALARAGADAQARATQAAASGAEMQRGRDLGEMDFQRRMLGQIAQDRSKLYQQEQDTRGMRGIAERNIGGTLQDIGRALMSSGGIL